MRNTISKLCTAVSAPVAATRDALAEILQSVRDTASLLYNRMMENMWNGRERLKNIVEKEAEEEQQQEEDIDLTPHEHERALKAAYRSFVIPGAPKTHWWLLWLNQIRHQDVNQKSAKGNGACKDNYDSMSKIEEAYNTAHWIRPWGRKKCSGRGWQYRW